MKKSTLISGVAGSGKTKMFNELLSNSQKSSVQMDFKKFQLSTKSELREKFEIVGIDGITTIEQLEYIVNVQNTNQTIFALTTQLSVKTFPLSLLSNFEVVRFVS